MARPDPRWSPVIMTGDAPSQCPEGAVNIIVIGDVVGAEDPDPLLHGVSSDETADGDLLGTP